MSTMDSDNTTTDQERHEHLLRVLVARQATDRAKALLRAEITTAVEAGVPQTKIAEAANVNRITIRRWVYGEASAPRMES